MRNKILLTTIFILICIAILFNIIFTNWLQTFFIWSKDEVNNYLFNDNDDEYDNNSESFQSRNNITKENLYRLKEIVLNSDMTDDMKLESIKLIKIDDPLFAPFIKYENNTASQKIINLTHVININDILISVIDDTEKVKRFRSLKIPFINQLMNSTKDSENVQNILLSVELFRLIFNVKIDYKIFATEIKNLRDEYKNKVSKNNFLILNMDVFINVFIVNCLNSINCKSNCIHKECGTSCDDWIKKENTRIENNRNNAIRKLIEECINQAKQAKDDYTNRANEKYNNKIVTSKILIENDYEYQKIPKINQEYDNKLQKINDYHDNLIDHHENVIKRKYRWWEWWNIQSKIDNIKNNVNNNREKNITNLNRERTNKIDNTNTYRPVDKNNSEKNLIKQKNTEINNVHVEIDKEINIKIKIRFEEIEQTYKTEQQRKEKYISDNCQLCKKKNEYDCLHILIPNIRKVTFDSLLNNFTPLYI